MQKTNKKQVKTTTKQKILLIIFGIFLTLLILEIGLRIGGFVLSSYQRASNKEGFDANYRILCLGESTTTDRYWNKNSWPAQLEVILNNRSSKIKFKVFNEGIGGTNTAFILSRLDSNLKEYKPNIVITMMGINDRGLIKYEENSKVKIILILRDLRVYKLARIISGAWKNKIQDSTIKDVSIVGGSKIIKEEYKEEAEKYLDLGRIYQEKGMFEEAEEMFKRAIEINPNDDEAYIELGGIYHEQGKFKEAEEIFGKVIEINPNNYEAYAELGWIYWEENRFKEAEEMLRKAIEINPNNDETDSLIFIRLIHIYHEQGISNKEIEKFLYDKKGILFKVDFHDLNITEYHYQQLYKKLNEEGIKYIAMQYPRVNIDKLKNRFKGDEDVIFVSNEENFNNALKEGSYDDYFIDKFADDFGFGHCTPKGNRLIAENVANIILKELNIEEGD